MIKSALEKIKYKIREIFELDLRSLALFRILLGLIILIDLFSRSFNLKAHYSDSGILPRAFLLDKISTTWDISINLISGRVEVQAIIFIISAISALLLILGFKTRTMIVICWFFQMSLEARNPMIINGADRLLRLLLFWSMFLPLNAYFSIDKYKIGIDNNPKINVSSLATFALIFQILYLYSFSAVLKHNPIWYVDGTALYYAFSLKQITYPLADYLLNFPQLLKSMTFYSIGLEVFGPLLVLIPFYNKYFRNLAIFLFVTFHLGINLCLDIGLFSPISICAWLALIPSNNWNFIENKLKNVKIINLPVKEKFFKFINKFPDLKSTITIKNNLFQKILLVFSFILVTLWNFSTIDKLKFPDILTPPTITLGLDQKWGMFSPFPLNNDGWFVIVGKLKNNKVVDIYKDGQEVSWNKPDNIRSTYKGERWRKFLENRTNDTLLYYGKYLCVEWNTKHTGEDQLMTFETFYMSQKTLINNQNSPIIKNSIWNHQCF